MFCRNCGKELRSDETFCSCCGAMVKDTANAASGESAQTVNAGAQNSGYGSTQAQGTQYANAVPVDAPHQKKKFFDKKTGIGIAIGAGAALVICLIVVLIINIVTMLDGRSDRDEYKQFGNNGGYSSGFGTYGYGDNDNYGYYGYGDSDDYGYYGYGDNYGSFGGSSGSSGSSGSGGSSGSSSSSDSPLPTDDKGNSMSDPNYEWPTGDNKYDFYAKSTIPSFESATGVTLKETQTDSDGNTYYVYDMNMDAYNEYVKILETYGYTQSDFNVEGQNSCGRYSNNDEAQYLDIYLMNSDGEIVIMA